MEKFSKIGIVGLGLIGGSIFKALCAGGYNVCAVSRSKNTLESAEKYSKNVSDSLETVKNCDLIFVCTPMNKTEEILDKFEEIISKETLVTDVSSLKGFLSVKKRPYKFIPSHPMAGTEFSGFENSFETLFKGAKWVLTPIDSNEQDLNKIKAIIEFLGAKPVVTTPKEHDEAVALISHMPMIVAQGIFESAKGNDLAMTLASSGFRDMTRLALSNTEMAKDMVELNSKNIETALMKLYASIGGILKEDYSSKIEEIKSAREKMYTNGKNVYPQ